MFTKENFVHSKILHLILPQACASSMTDVWTKVSSGPKLMITTDSEVQTHIQHSTIATHLCENST